MSPPRNASPAPVVSITLSTFTDFTLTTFQKTDRHIMITNRNNEDINYVKVQHVCVSACIMSEIVITVCMIEPVCVCLCVCKRIQV